MAHYIDKTVIENILHKLWKEDKGYGYIDTARTSYNKALQKVQCEIDALEVKEVQEETVSEELEDFAKRQADEFAEREYEGGSYDRGCLSKGYYWGCKAGAKWQAENLWKPADGDCLPEIDREVIALLDNGKVVFAHRPSEHWDGKNIITGKVTRYYPKTYDKGGWNIPNLKYWLDYPLPE
jgi:hypothetical protein